MKKPFLMMLAAVMVAFGASAQKPEQTICAFGGDINEKFVQYVVDLTSKSNPKVCYIPTASADNADNIEYWNDICKKLAIEPHVLKVWVNSYKNTESFEDILLGMDAIIVGGGNTLNMLGIWKAQGIDIIMRKALERGIVLAGGSAGSICWFHDGVSDSRPVHLSIVDGLSFLPYSNCPHYDDAKKQDLYNNYIAGKKMKAGYAIDNRVAILFRNGKFVEAVTQKSTHNAYFVSRKKGKAVIENLNARILVKKGALPIWAYDVIAVGKQVRDFPEMNSRNTPLEAYVSIQYIMAEGRNSLLKSVSSFSIRERMGDSEDATISEKSRDGFLKMGIDRVFVYGDSLAGVVTNYKGFCGLWWFYREDGQWMSAGEDIGGDTPIDAEITFREKARIHLEKMNATNVQ